MSCRVAFAPPSNNNNQKQCTPLPFTAECQQLHCAFKGFGCDEATVIRILASKKMHERQQSERHTLPFSNTTSSLDSSRNSAASSRKPWCGGCTTRRQEMQ